MDAKAFGELLRQYRTAAGFSQEHLAELAHLSAESIGALERGIRRAPYRETVALISKALRLDDIARAELEAAAQRGRARGTRVRLSSRCQLSVILPSRTLRMSVAMKSIGWPPPVTPWKIPVK